MDILFSDIIVLTMNDEGQGKPASSVLSHGYVGIKGQKVVYVDEKPPTESAARVINGFRRLLMPGLINSHTHLPMSILRGYADDCRLQEWLFDHVFPAEAKLDKRCVAAGTRLALAECIRFGVISCTEMYFHLPQVAEAVIEAGTKANVTNGLLCLDMSKFDFENDRGTKELRELLARYKDMTAESGQGNKRLIVDAGIHGEYTSGPEAWRKTVAFAAENNLRLHIHLSESKPEHDGCIERYGKTPIEILHENGVFTRKTTAAHCCWITENDMDILAANNATAAHCPISNLKLSSGVAPVTRMLSRKLNVALGTDGVCSNNNHDLFEEIKTAALLQKHLTGDPSALPAYEAIKLATVNGALGQGRENETAKIQPGFDADLIMLNLDAPHLFPMHDPLATVAYAARGSDVCMTMVQGRVLYENGEYKTIDMEKVRHEMESYVLPRLS